MKRIFCLLLFVLLLPLMLPAHADPEPPDPPGRVGRVSWLDGSVFLRNEYYDSWQRVGANWPVTTGDVLWTGAGARVEIRIGSTVLRVDSGSELEVVRIDDQVVTVMLHSGSAATHLHSDAQAAGFTLRTRDGNAMPLVAGRYRVDYDERATVVSVISGRLSFAGGDGQIDLGAGSRTEIWHAGRMNTLSQALRSDPFSDWVEARDRYDESLRAMPLPRYVSTEMTGYEDLNRNGNWSQDEDYGAVWYPSVVPVGWAPYRTGRWVWVRPWGWSWVDDAPWGFAPFHYGRWVHHHGRWGWAPGRYVPRPVYAPALVVWFGGQHSGSATPVGWLPLAPREIYVPGYRATPIYQRKLNDGHFDPRHSPRERMAPPTNYRNRRAPDAVTFVPSEVFAGARPVAPARLVNTPVAGAPLTHIAPVAPPRPPRPAGGPTQLPEKPPVAAVHAPVKSPVGVPAAPVVSPPARDPRAQVAPAAGATAAPGAVAGPAVSLPGAIDRRPRPAAPPEAAKPPVAVQAPAAPRDPRALAVVPQAAGGTVAPGAVPATATSLPGAIDRRPRPAEPAAQGVPSSSAREHQDRREAGKAATPVTATPAASAPAAAVTGRAAVGAVPTPAVPPSAVQAAPPARLPRSTRYPDAPPAGASPSPASAVPPPRTFSPPASRPAPAPEAARESAQAPAAAVHPAGGAASHAVPAAAAAPAAARTEASGDRSAAHSRHVPRGDADAGAARGARSDATPAQASATSTAPAPPAAADATRGRGGDGRR